MANFAKEMTNYFTNAQVKRADDERYSITSLRFCLKCKTVWEAWTYVTRNFAKHEDMPSYGLKREDCRDCSER